MVAESTPHEVPAGVGDITETPDDCKDEMDTKNLGCKDGRHDAGKLNVFIKAVRTDPIYRHRFTHTLVVWWSFVGLGWLVGMSGPVFPDLRLIIGGDIGTSSWLFTAGSFGYLTGSLIGGVLYDKLNKVFLLAASTLGMGVSALMTPYCSTLATMLFIRFSGGFFCGGLDTGGNADILYVWGSQSGPYMQAVHFGFSLGALISPLATEPFLARKILKCHHHNKTDATTNAAPVVISSEYVTLPTKYTFDHITTGIISLTSRNTESSSTSIPTSQFLQNSTSNSSTVTPNSRHDITVTMKNYNMICTETYGETHVHYAYLLTTVIILSSTVGFIYLYFRLKFSPSNKSQVKEASKSDRADDTLNRHELSTARKVLFLSLLAILISAYCVVEDGFSSFLMTFGLEYLDWDKLAGSLATATFWIAFGIGRFVGIFTVSLCSSSRMLTTYLLFLVVGLFGFFISTLFLYKWLIWIFTAVLGTSMSVIFPAIFSWTSENIVHVSGKISAVFLTSASLAGMTFPLVIGNLMEYFHPMWFVYVLMIVLGIDLLVYFLIRLLSKLTPGRLNARRDIEIEVQNEDGTEMKLLSKQEQSG